MLGFLGALVSVIVVQSWGDAVEGRPVVASWTSSAKLVALLVAVAAAFVAAARVVA